MFMLYYRLSYIMPDFRYNMTKTIENVRQSAILDFISDKFVIGYFCVRAYILFYIHGPAILLNCFLVT